MEPIPGSATERIAGDSAGIEAFNTTYPTGNGWGSSHRWEEFGGEKPPMTPPRVRALADKRECVVLVVRDDGTIESLGGGVDGGASKTHAKPKNWLAEFAFGAELLAGYKTGSLFAYPIENRRGGECMPTQAKWKLRSPHVRVVEVITGAQVGLKKRGVVISHRELAELKNKSGRSVIGLKERQVGTVVRELCAWGHLRRTPVAVARGKATSFRANAYQLTTLGALVWGLKLPDACGPLPDPVMRDLPAAKKPTTGSDRNRQELPGNPETPLRGIPPEEHAAFPRMIVGSPSGAHTATRAASERTAAGPATCAPSSTSELPSRAIAARGPAGVGDACARFEPATRPTNPSGVPNLEASTRTDALSDGSVSRESRTPLLCPTGGAGANDELELAERRVGDAAGAVRRGDFDDRYVEGDPRETARRLKIARARVLAQEKAELAQRAAAQQALVRQRESARRHSGGGRSILERDDERAPGNGVIDPEIEAVIRRHRDSLTDETREQRYNLQPPTKPEPTLGPDAELADKIESIWRTRFGVATVGAQVELDKWRGGKS